MIGVAIGIRGIQIPIVNAAPPTSPSRGFLPGRFAYAGPGLRGATIMGAGIRIADMDWHLVQRGAKFAVI